MFILDNLWAHKSSLIVDLVKDYERVQLLLTPSNTPEFSPIGKLIILLSLCLKKIYLVLQKGSYKISNLKEV